MTTNFTMPLELKTKWVAALRSGEFKQGRNRLYSKADDTYCCLGVLEYVAGDGVEQHGLPSIEWLNAHDFKFNGTLGLVPSLIAPNHPNIPSEFVGNPMRMSHMNDDYRLTFPEIADLVEAQVEGV